MCGLSTCIGMCGSSTCTGMCGSSTCIGMCGIQHELFTLFILFQQFLFVIRHFYVLVCRMFGISLFKEVRFFFQRKKKEQKKERKKETKKERKNLSAHLWLLLIVINLTYRV